jgi:hypothetical protein
MWNSIKTLLRRAAENKYFDLIIGALTLACALTEFGEFFHIEQEEGLGSHHAVFVLGAAVFMKGLLSLLVGSVLVVDAEKESSSGFVHLMHRVVGHWLFNMSVSVLLIIVGGVELAEEIAEVEGEFSVWHAGVIITGLVFFMKSQSILLDAVSFLRKTAGADNKAGRLAARIVLFFNHPYIEMVLAVLIVVLGVAEAFFLSGESDGHAHKGLIVYGVGRLVKLSEPLGIFVDLIEDAEKAV